MADQPLRPSVADDLGSLASLVAAAPRATTSELAAGTVIGDHFVIEEAIGRGGMGAVYRARDRRLDRKVALKVDVRGADVARARREAVALARLAHPNVVTIYEIGEDAGAPFVAMELCDGGTARSWLRGRTGRWRDVLAIYRDAARGLAAAHAAGLVHRDVKPDNILIGGDGRARIGDFGLARDVATLGAASARAIGDLDVALDAVVTATATGDGADAASRDAGAASPLHAGVTATGAVVGTPRYMAPEQRAGESIDARADQFGFGVALYEALAGVDPFPGDPVERAAAIASGTLAAPSRDRGVPRRVLQVIARGLREDPAARWPSMDALGAALDRAARRRWPYAAAALALIALGAAGSAWAIGDREPASSPPSSRASASSLASASSPSSLASASSPSSLASAMAARAPDPCADVIVDLGAVWRSDARAGFIAHHGKATATAAWTADVLDRFTADWNAARRAVCVEAPRDPAWSRDVIGKAVDCLRDSRVAIERLVGAGDVAPSDLVALTTTPADPIGCGKRDSVSLVHSPPADPRAAAEQAAVIELIDQAQRAAETGDLDGAAALGDRALVAAANGTPQARALAEQSMGRIALARRDFDGAMAHLRAAYFEFRAISDGNQTFATAFQLAQSYAAAGKVDDAAEWLEHARAEGERVSIAPSHLAMMAQVEALIARARGQHDAAVTAMAKGIAALDAAHDPVMVPNQIRSLVTQSTLLAEAGRLDESIAVAKDALARQERLLGPDHPDELPTLTDIGLGYADQGKVDDALPWLARARALADRVYDADAIDRAATLVSYGKALARRDPAAAVPVLTEALRIVDKDLGASSEDAVDLRAQLAALRAAAR